MEEVVTTGQVDLKSKDNHVIFGEHFFLEMVMFGTSCYVVIAHELFLSICSSNMKD